MGDLIVVTIQALDVIVEQLLLADGHVLVVYNAMYERALLCQARQVLGNVEEFARVRSRSFVEIRDEEFCVSF